MREQLITYETAQLAKIKNFDINTTGDCWVKTLDGDIIHNSARKNCIEHDRCEQYLMQPSQTLLQKWLREKHNTIITVFPFTITNFITDDIDDDEFIFSYVIHQNSFFMKDNTDFKTYETALEHALQEALNIL